MKAVCSTDPSNPAQSLIKSICYPDQQKFCSAATKWGCDHEKVALDKFVKLYRTTHENVVLEEAGLFIDPEHPFIAASPDGIVSCDCCGKSVVEMKCPFCKKDSTLDETTQFLVREEAGGLQLDQKHAYYYQLQTQMGCTKVESGYFVVYTNCDLHMERTLFDSSLWQELCFKADHIFKTAVLPELVGKFFTRLPGTPLSRIINREPTQKDKNTDDTWCYCREGESGRMICCDNENCSLLWFHYLCLKISSAPKGTWFCPDCRKLPQFSKCRGRKKDIPSNRAC